MYLFHEYIQLSADSYCQETWLSGLFISRKQQRRTGNNASTPYLCQMYIP